MMPPTPNIYIYIYKTTKPQSGCNWKRKRGGGEETQIKKSKNNMRAFVMHLEKLRKKKEKKKENGREGNAE